MKSKFLLLLLVLPLVFFSCKDDDDDPDPINPVVGDWELDRIALENVPAQYRNGFEGAYEPGLFGQAGASYEIKIKDDNSFVYKIYYGEVFFLEGTWEFDENLLILTFDDGDTEEYELDGDYLVRRVPNFPFDFPDPDDPDNPEAGTKFNADFVFYLERDF